MAVFLRPLRDKTIVQRIETDNTSTGGIIIPEGAKEKPQTGKVIAVGTGRVLDNGSIKEPEVKKGDKVLFGSFAGSEVKVEKETFLILSESEILAVVNE